MEPSHKQCLEYKSQRAEHHGGGAVREQSTMGKGHPESRAPWELGDGCCREQSTMRARQPENRAPWEGCREQSTMGTGRAQGRVLTH